MDVKAKVLALFTANLGEYLSGEDIAREISVSRSAVWKAVNLLRSDGYEIDAATNKGYLMPARQDILSAKTICLYLSADNPFDISVIDSTASTNAAVWDMAASGADEGRVLVARGQTDGKGRQGRQFYSPPNTGLYLSLLLRPRDMAADRQTHITTMAAVAMCEAIEQISGAVAQIKWVNDIFIGGKKVCGILTNGSFGMENAAIEYAVLGAGVNVYEPKGGFTPELADIARAIYDDAGLAPSDAKSRLAAAFLDAFWRYYTSANTRTYVAEYCARSMVIGRRVRLSVGSELAEGKVLDIDDDCHLLIAYDDGSRASYSSGEIHIIL